VCKSLRGEYKPSPDEGRAFWTVDVVGKSLGWRGNNHFLLPTRATSITDDSDLEFSVDTEYLCAALDHGDENIIFPVVFPEKYHGGAAHMVLFVANVRSMEVRLLDPNPSDAANPLQYLEVAGFIGQELSKRLNGNPTFTSFRDNSCPAKVQDTANVSCWRQGSTSVLIKIKQQRAYIHFKIKRQYFVIYGTCHARGHRSDYQTIYRSLFSSFSYTSHSRVPIPIGYVI
jgi:hypothetical protein